MSFFKKMFKEMGESFKKSMLDDANKALNIVEALVKLEKQKIKLLEEGNTKHVDDVQREILTLVNDLKYIERVGRNIGF